MRQSSISFDSLRMHATAVACGFLLIVAGAQAGSGQQPATASGTPAQATLPANSALTTPPKAANVAEGPPERQSGEAAGPGKPRGEGIQIHGHWVLEVKGADGKVRDRREFDNSLVTTYTTVSPTNSSPVTTSGAAYMAALLSGNIVPGDPAIGFVQGTLTGDPSLWCAPAANGPTNSKITCYTYTTARSLWNNSILSAGTSGDVSLQLGLNLAATYIPTASLVLSGNYSVPVGLTTISAVQTLFGGCAAPPEAGAVGFFPLGNGASGVGYGTGLNGIEFLTEDNAPKVCTLNNVGTPTALDVQVLGALTSTAVTVGTTASPIPVTTGEIVAVTVTISFS